MAKNNYGFQKRSRELAKKKKKEEKRLRKQQGKTGPEAGPEVEGVVDESQAVEMPAEADGPNADAEDKPIEGGQ